MNLFYIFHVHWLIVFVRPHFCFAMLKMSPNVVVWVDDDLPSLLLLLLLSLRGSLDSQQKTRNRYLKRNQQPMDHKKEQQLEEECGGCLNQLTKTFYLFCKNMKYERLLFHINMCIFISFSKSKILSISCQLFSCQ